MWERVSRIILRYRIPLLVFVVLLTAGMFYFVRQVTLAYSYYHVIPKNDSDYVYYQKFKKIFGEDGNILVIGFQTDSLFTPRALNAIYNLTEELKKLPGVQGHLTSLTHLYTVEREEGEKKFRVLPLTEHPFSSYEEADTFYSRIQKLPFYSGLLYNPNTNASVILVPFAPEFLEHKERLSLTQSVIDISNRYRDELSSELHFSGLPLIRSVMVQKISSELFFFLIVIGIVTALVLLAFFRNFYAVFVPLGVIGCGVILSMGVLVLLNYRVTMLTGIVPSLIVVIGIPNSIYFLTKYIDEYRRSRDKIKSLVITIRRIGLLTLMTNTTTAGGFLSLSFTNIQLMKEFGVLAFISILATYIISLILLPAIYSFLPVPSTKQIQHLDFKPLKDFVGFVEKTIHVNRDYVYTCVFIVVLVSFFGIIRLEPRSFMMDDVPKREKMYSDLMFFEENFRGVMPFEIVIDTRKKNGARNLAMLKKIQRFQNELKKYPELSQPVSAVNMMQFITQAFYNGNPKEYRLPTNEEQAFILSYLKNNTDADKIVKSLIDSNYQLVRISVRMADIGSVKLKPLLTSLRQKADDIFDPQKFSVHFTGTSYIFLRANDYLIKNLIWSLVIAFVVIAGLVAILFTTPRMIIVSLIPNFMPSIVTAAIMGYFNIPLKPSTAIVFSIAFGITVDSSINFLLRYRRHRKHGEGIEQSVSKTIHEAGTSIIFANTILFLGFIVFVFSTFGGTIALGLLMSVCLIVGMFANLFLLPSLVISVRSFTRNDDIQKSILGEVAEESSVEILPEENSSDSEYGKNGILTNGKRKNFPKR